MTTNTKDQYIHNLKRFGEVSSQHFESIDFLCKAYINLGRDIYGLDTSIVSHIRKDDYTILWSESPLKGLSKGVHFNLGETYCSAVISSKRNITYDCVGTDSEMKNHPVYVNAKLESYIGCPIIVGGEVYGTLSFSDTRTRNPAFEEYDLSMMNLIAKALGNAIDYYFVLKSKEDFISIMSHEIRTPVTSLTGALKLLSEFTEGKLDNECNELLDVSMRNVEHLLLLVNDLLDLEQFSGGSSNLSVEEVGIHTLIDEFHLRVKGYALEHNSEVLVKGKLPELFLLLDKRKVLQALLNLGANAIKFSPENSKIWVEIVESESELRINIIDSGTGIPENKKQFIFERFTQVDSTDSRKQGGSGLGLAIAKQIMELHYGKIGFENNQEEGSNFFIVFNKQF